MKNYTWISYQFWEICLGEFWPLTCCVWHLSFRKGAEKQPMPWHWSDDCPLARTSLWYCTFLEFLEHCVLLWLSLFYLIMRHRRVASPHHLVKMMKFLRPEKPLQGQISGFGGTITKRLASLMLLSHHLEILLSIDDAIMELYIYIYKFSRAITQKSNLSFVSFIHWILFPPFWTTTKTIL